MSHFDSLLSVTAADFHPALVDYQVYRAVGINLDSVCSPLWILTEASSKSIAPDPHHSPAGSGHPHESSGWFFSGQLRE